MGYHAGLLGARLESERLNYVANDHTTAKLARTAPVVALVC